MAYEVPIKHSIFDRKPNTSRHFFLILAWCIRIAGLIRIPLKDEIPGSNPGCTTILPDSIAVSTAGSDPVSESSNLSRATTNLEMIERSCRGKGRSMPPEIP